MSTESKPFQTLPVDLHAKIFRHVGAVPDLIQVRLVCKEFTKTVTNKNYRCCSCNMILRHWRSNPDESFCRLAWEPQTNRLILWYSSARIDTDMQEQIQSVLNLIQHIDVGNGVTVDVTRSSALLRLIFSGKWPVRNDFARTPSIVRKHCNPLEYPSENDLAFLHPNRLTEISGYPSQLACAKQKQVFWRQGMVALPCLRIAHSDYVVDRGFAVNESGWMAVLTLNELTVYRPVGHRFKVAASTPVNGVGGGRHRVRVRYSENIVFIFAHYVIRKFIVDEETSTVALDETFEDDYARQQSFTDMDVQGRFLVAVWRKWAGFYLKKDFDWFHAVSISSVLSPPKSVSLKNNYLHVSNGSCIFAFHPASRDPTVLWVNGNLPRDSNRDVPFCVSSRYGVFSAVHGDIVQSYYEAMNAQAVFGHSATVGDGVPCPTPVPSNDLGKHILDPVLKSYKPFQTTDHIEYDEKYGRHGRLLCYDQTRSCVTMCVSREEFDPLIELVVQHFGCTVPVEAVLTDSLEERWAEFFRVGDRIQVQLADVGWKDGVIEKIDSEDEMQLQIAYEGGCVSKPLSACRTLNLTEELSGHVQLAIEQIMWEYTRDYGDEVVRLVLQQAVGLEVTGVNETFCVRFRPCY